MHKHDWQIYYSSEGIGYYECRICKTKGFRHFYVTNGEIVEASNEKRDDE